MLKQEKHYISDVGANYTICIIMIYTEADLEKGKRPLNFSITEPLMELNERWKQYRKIM